MKRKKKMSSAKIILMGFLGIIIIGSLLLSLPISHAEGVEVSYIDALFTATTATCVTGLVTLSTVSAWSVFGQAVILLLIQIGGLGFITVFAGFMMIMGKKLDMEERILISDSFNLTSLSGIQKFVRKAIFFTFIVEALGAFSYMTVFIPEFGAKGIWMSVFNSVSAFCNAGMDIVAENSLCNYVHNPTVNITTMLLIIAGGIGFIVWFDMERAIQNKRKKKSGFLSLHTKITLSVTAFLIAVGAILIFIFEYNNPLTMKDYSLGEKIMASLFQSVTTRTAGFATVMQENLSESSAFVSMLLMFVGGSPAGTAGGIKTVTAFVLILTFLSTIKNKRTVDAFGRQISYDSIKKAVSVFTSSFLIMVLSTVLVLASGGGNVLDVLYETVSATATVGLTRNLTAGLNEICKMIIIMTMYFGRVGPISLAFALSSDKCEENRVANPVEEISIG